MNEFCPFCPPPADRLIWESHLSAAFYDLYPASQGHALIVPRRHCATWFDASPEEQQDMMAGVAAVRDLLDQKLHPDGYNLGVNVGEAAGQTVFHVHVHVIPRYQGDVPDPRGGVRHAIPRKGNPFQVRDALS